MIKGVVILLCAFAITYIIEKSVKLKPTIIRNVVNNLVEPIIQDKKKLKLKKK